MGRDLRARPARRRAPLAVLASALALTLLFSTLTVLGSTERAVGASYTFLVNSLSLTGDDVSPGDGVCMTQ
jgi:hypothetical protein